jgi:hypothetical protein
MNKSRRRSLSPTSQQEIQEQLRSSGFDKKIEEHPGSTALTPAELRQVDLAALVLAKARANLSARKPLLGESICSIDMVDALEVVQRHSDGVAEPGYVSAKRHDQLDRHPQSAQEVITYAAKPGGLLDSRVLNEVRLWHGTRTESLYEILIAGFDESRAQPGLYAAGVYFASQACKSAQYATKYWSERGSCPDECSSGQSKGKGKGEGEDAKILTHPRGGEGGGQLCSDGRIKAGRTTFLLYSRVLLGWKPHLVQHCGNLALDPCSGARNKDSWIATSGTFFRVPGPVRCCVPQVHEEYVVPSGDQVFPEYVVEVDWVPG